MRLAIVHNGQVFDVVDDLEGYDLQNPYGQSVVLEAIQREVARIEKHEDEE